MAFFAVMREGMEAAVFMLAAFQVSGDSAAAGLGAVLGIGAAAIGVGIYHGGVLRRGYNYTDGIDAMTRELDAGLFFVCFQRDPHAQFAALQRRLGVSDALNEYIQHTSSAVFAVPPGARSGGYVGEGML
jgi:hypothetical protein